MNILEIARELEMIVDITLLVKDQFNHIHLNAIEWEDISIDIEKKAIIYDVHYNKEIFSRDQTFIILGIASKYGYEVKQRPVS